MLGLARRVGAPVVTRLDAKGALPEDDPHSIGVVGVHGKPGMAATAAVIDEASLLVPYLPHMAADPPTLAPYCR